MSNEVCMCRAIWMSNRVGEEEVGVGRSGFRTK